MDPDARMALLQKAIAYRCVLDRELAATEALVATDVRDVIPKDKLQPILQNPPFIRSQSLFNLRDAGAVAGSAIPRGRVYRCGTLAYAAEDPEAREWLRVNVRNIYDLRTRGLKPDATPDPVISGVYNTWLPAARGYQDPKLFAFALGSGVPAWTKKLLNVALSYKFAFGLVLEQVRDRPQETMLIHCAAGRDRTDVLIGLLNHLAGSSPEVALYDYMLSRIGLEPVRDKLITLTMETVKTSLKNTPGFWNLVRLSPEYWCGFVVALNERFGGWDGYVTAEEGLGFSKKDLKTIKVNMRTVVRLDVSRGK